MANSPAPVTAIRLIISGVELTLGLGEHVLGRAAECAVFVQDPLASRRHAVITVSPDGVTIRDLGSRNGVILNGEEIDHNHALSVGDLITIGSQALAVLAICRGGHEGGPSKGPRGHDGGPSEGPRGHDGGPSEGPPNPPGRPALKAPLGRIAVQKRAVPESVLDDRASANTTLSQSSPLGRPAGAFRMIAEAAMLAIATNRPEKAEKILEAPLLEVLATLRAGIEVESEIIDIAVQQALCLCEISREPRWADYVHDLYDQMRIPMPLAVTDRLAMAMTRRR